MSARTPTTGPGLPPRRMPTTPVFATGWRTSRPSARSRSATNAPVRTSRLPSSGFWWMSRRVATSAGVMASAAARISASGAAAADAARTSSARVGTRDLQDREGAMLPRNALHRGDGRAVEHAPFAGGEVPPDPVWRYENPIPVWRAEGQRADRHTHELDHVVPDRGAHAADLPVLALGDHDL